MPSRAVLVALLALGCAAPASKHTANAPPPVYTFSCADGYVVKASFGGDTVVVTLPDTTLVMHHLISADGARYGAGNLVFWEKGLSAFVLRNESIVHRDCARRDTAS